MTVDRQELQPTHEPCRLAVENLDGFIASARDGRRDRRTGVF